jgi:hypothetical protein
MACTNGSNGEARYAEVSAFRVTTTISIACSISLSAAPGASDKSAREQHPAPCDFAQPTRQIEMFVHVVLLSGSKQATEPADLPR